MTREEFELGIPFENADNKEILKPIYSYVNVKGVQCIQEYNILNNMKPRFHCTVVDIFDTRIYVRVNICGNEITHYLELNNLNAIADKFGRRIKEKQKLQDKEEPIARYTHDCMEAQVLRVPDDLNMYYVKIIDLYADQVVPGPRREYYELNEAIIAAKKEIGYGL
jgi:uncharacterized FlaG/YvyC family protein